MQSQLSFLAEEEWVRQSLFRRDPLLRVQVHHLVEQVERLRSAMGEGVLQVLRLRVLFELEVAPLFQLVVEGAVVLGWRAEDAEGAVQHLLVALAEVDGLGLQELAEQAPQRPHVDAQQVVFAAQDDLGRPVPETDDAVALAPLEEARLLGKSEVGQLEHPVSGDQNIFGLDVAVEDHFAVQDVDGLQQLHHDVLDLLPLQGSAALLEPLEESGLAELEDAVDFVGVRAPLLEDVEQPHEVGVLSQLLQKRNFPHRRVVDSVGDVFEEEGLERHDRVGFRVDALVHFAVGALAELLYDLVLTDVGLPKLDSTRVELGPLSEHLRVLLRLAQLASGLRLEALVDAVVQRIRVVALLVLGLQLLAVHLELRVLIGVEHVLRHLHVLVDASKLILLIRLFDILLVVLVQLLLLVSDILELPSLGNGMLKFLHLQ